MKNYEKPVVMINEELAEGVYAASGVTYYDDCYTVTIKEIKQELQDGRMSYCIQYDAIHTADHHGGLQQLIITFDRPVEHVSGGTLVSGNNTRTLTLDYSYHQNPSDKVGNGALYVYTPDVTLSVEDAVFTCNHKCFTC